MSALRRTLAVGAPAIVITAGLFVLMQQLVAEEFTPEDTVAIAELEIIEKQPTPPSVEAPKSAKPKNPIATMPDDANVFEWTTPDVKATLATRPSFEPHLIRIPPQMPPSAERSGHCQMRYNVDLKGQPFDVVATYCTEPIFEGPSVQSVRGWRYPPKIQDGRPVGRTGVESKISFRLTDERGNIIPE